jgi:hypothetical protein
MEAAVVAPSGTGCGFGIGCAAGDDIALYSDAPHPVNIEDAATAEKPRKTWRREIIGRDTGILKTKHLRLEIAKTV